MDASPGKTENNPKIASPENPENSPKIPAKMLLFKSTYIYIYMY